MGEFNFKDDSFKQLLKQKESQIHIRTNEGIQETDNFKNLHRTLITYQKKNPVTDYTAILITKEEIENLIYDYSEKLFKNLTSEVCVINNHLLFNRNLDVIGFERKEIKDNNEARKFYLELSKEICVFLISPNDVHYFVDGNDIGKTIFFTLDALKTYNGLKEISKIVEIFEEYRLHLKDRNIYSKFFASKSAKSSLCKHLMGSPSKKDYESFLDEHKQLLENKPEVLFRDDLLAFLRKTLKAHVLAKEYLLDNLKRLDIYINDDFGELYLIEVKWVGISIHAKGQEIGFTREAKHINPDAVVQSVKYIKQLYEENKTIKLGYLAVFDARYEDLPDTLHDFDENVITEDLKSFRSKYIKILDFRVLNTHPI